MYDVDISPNPIEISIDNFGGGGGSSDLPVRFIRFKDVATDQIRYVYVENGILYISDTQPSIGGGST